MICPHCGKEQHKFTANHIPGCVMRPAAQAALARWLPDPDVPGYARSQRNWETHTPNMPDFRSVVKHYGKWSLAAQAFGLRPFDSNEYRVAIKLKATGLELARLAKELHRGDYGPSCAEYRVNVDYGATGTGAMHPDVLIDRFGDWAAVLSNWGYQLPPARVLRRVVDEPWLKHREARVEQSVILPPWSLKYGFE